MKFVRLVLSFIIPLLLAACSSAGQMVGSPGSPAAEMLPDRYGTGPRVVGVIAFEEPGNLSDGASNSVHLAARLAASTLKGDPITVLVRTLSAQGDNAASIITELDAAGATIVIGPGDEQMAAAVAKVMAIRGAPTLSLTSFADLALQLYGAGYVPNEEAVALVNEAAKRGYSSLAVVSAEGRSSTDFVKAVVSLASAAGINARVVDGTTDSQFVAGMGAAATAGVSVSAVVFATGPVRAGAMMALLRQDPRFASVAVVGNSGWSLGKPPPSLRGAWYTTLASDGIGEFAAKFTAANGASATLNAAMVYDLVVLTAALPQAIAEEPYHPEVMTNGQGFKGFTGQFRFGPTGMLAARSYVIATVK